ncbi:MAG: hypothetical protein ACP5KW_12360 [Thermoproteota archaeon]
MEEKHNAYYWQKVVENKLLRIDLEELKNATEESFRNESDNYKQKLVFNMLEAIKNNDQNRFFNILLRAINKPKKNFKQLWETLERNYDVMPNEAFINFAYTVVLGIMATYAGGEESE